MIRALDIRRGERWTDGRVPLHMVEATESAALKPRRRVHPWRALAWVILAPTGFALALVATYQILRKGLL